ncbi:kinase [Wenjunlia vitaminophila]|uniref:Kinase n=1 Tax=Wenjunlia vitaminophila TaxID=76728 RepID=A0A0T6LYH1_WENVI|nr:aminoglycoside phosphotransferase family protein [Wenjunlia vitaminophila]KRV51033.1 kinase [Wenjunlia vitaminophila]
MPQVPLQPPARLVRTVSAWEGEPGQSWAHGLPERARRVVERWELTPERVLEPGGNISMVVLVLQADGTPATLKLGLVTPETAQEPAALARWDGRGAVRLLRTEPDEGALLLERLQGEVSLRSLPESKAMLEATGVLRRLWVHPGDDHPFRGVPGYTGGLVDTLSARAAQPWAAELRPLADEALRVRADLVASEPERVLLHGDYHHGNVLAAGPSPSRGPDRADVPGGGSGERPPWLAIDPKPLVGERAYDLAWLVRDRLDTLVASPGPAAATRRRLHRLADDLEVDRERLRGWSLFRAVEAGLWSLAVGDRDAGELLLEFATWL